MRKATYWLCFALVSIATWQHITAFAYWFINAPRPRGGAPLWLFESFIDLIPRPWLRLVPSGLKWCLTGGMCLLVARRAWLLVADRGATPSGYRGIPFVLGIVGLTACALFAFVWQTPFGLRLKSGLTLASVMPYMYFCIAWAFLLAELLSLGNRVPKAVRSS
jgi:hypothetical protein